MGAPPLFDLWTSYLSCGCWTKPISADGHPYGRAREGSYSSCVDDLRHQGSYKVLQTLPYDQAVRAGAAVTR